MPRPFSEKPSTVEEYIEWYTHLFGEDLESGSTEQWYDQVTTAGQDRVDGSIFWTDLQNSLNEWNVSFQADHDDYRLFDETTQPTKTLKKSFASVLNKSFRWNVVDNKHWPDPPNERRPSTAARHEEPDREDKQCWFGPHNWLNDFPDIFRTRLVATYFDGVGYFAENITSLAERTTSVRPELEYLASNDGYHAAHVRVYHQIRFVHYDTGETITVPVSLEIQVTTTIQTTISNMLHRVYENWRLNGAPSGWEWDHKDPAFSVNYLGNTLHYLDGMIVIARVQMEDG